MGLTDFNSYVTALNEMKVLLSCAMFVQCSFAHVCISASSE